jgi:2-amino-4-deoxychorismate synthase
MDDGFINYQKPYALLEKNGVITAYEGTLHKPTNLAALSQLAMQSQRDIVFALPYRTIQERGFVAHGDEPILALVVETAKTIKAEDLPGKPFALAGDITPSLADEAYAALIADFQKNAIEKGECAQATISRRFEGRILDFHPDLLLSLYRQLLLAKGHYMTVLFVADDRYLLAGTPERHLELTTTHAKMTPIAGTFRKADKIPLKNFLQDPKEINELFQVVDEEMKMMGLICPEGGTITGPYLRDVGAVVHTEYNLVGKRGLSAMEALRRSLHAPTVVGSPLESAARQIAHFEGASRGYYAGEIGLYRPADDTLDCAILIRGAEIRPDGSFHVQAGGGIVRDSDPKTEAKESRAKASGLLNMLQGKNMPPLSMTTEEGQDIQKILTERNKALSAFWQSDQAASQTGFVKGLNVTIVNNEDDFAFMLAHMLAALGAIPRVIDTFAFDAASDQGDLVILGPGPGDPTDKANPRMAALHQIVDHLRAARRPLFGICLGHQVLAHLAGVPVTRQTQSTQGMPRRVRVNGHDVTLAFYNSFSPVRDPGRVPPFAIDEDDDGRIIAFRGDRMAGYQFHPESVMSIDGMDMVKDALRYLGFAA